MTEYILTVKDTKTNIETTHRGMFSANEVATLKSKVNTIASDGVRMLTKVEPVHVNYAKEFLNSITPKR